MMTVMVMICQGTQNLNAFYAKKYVVSNDDDDDEWVFWRLKTRVVQTIGRDKSLSQRNWQKLHCFRNSVDIICKSGPRTPPKCPISRNSLSLLLENTMKNKFKFLHQWWNLSLLPVCKLFHHSGECKCPAGFKGMDCEIPCERGRWTRIQSLTILQNPARFNNIFQNVSLITDLGSVARTSAPAPPRTLTAATRWPASVSATRSELVTCICQTCYKICQTCYKICQTSYKICLRSYMYLYLMTWLWPHGSRPRQCKVPPLKRSQKVQLRGVVLSLGNTIHWLVMKSGMSYDNNDDNWEKMQTTADKEPTNIDPAAPRAGKGRTAPRDVQSQVGARIAIRAVTANMAPATLTLVGQFRYLSHLRTMLCIIFLAWNSAKVVNTRWMYLREGLHW